MRRRSAFLLAIAGVFFKISPAVAMPPDARRGSESEAPLPNVTRGSAARYEAGLCPAGTASSEWGYAPGSGLFLASMMAGRSPASHQAAEPLSAVPHSSAGPAMPNSFAAQPESALIRRQSRPRKLLRMGPLGFHQATLRAFTTAEPWYAVAGRNGVAS